ncbi:Meiotic recombination protein dmc1 [Taxawa tesnikishii (nom. ined.)]|nr:Meiotic recombination protein dmc1 [Dothideales sp. JES 119]
MPESEHSDSDDEGVLTVEELQNHGINAADITKLRSAGYWTIGAIECAPRKNLLKIKGFSEIKVEKVKEAVQKITGPGFQTAFEFGQVRKKVIKLSTGSSQLDTILNGGFETGSINEVYGEFRCGKTQMAHTLSVVAQLPKSQKGGGGKVVYFDTEGTFRPERIAEIAERFELDKDVARENIIYSRVRNSENQHELLDRVMEFMLSGEYRLVVVDSIMALFRTDYNGRGELSERQGKLNQYLQRLKQTAEEFNVCVFMTNQVQSDPGATFGMSVDGRKPVGGHILAHAATTRILLRKGRAEERVAKIVDSPDCAEKEATYIITTGGINDPEKA